MLPLLLLLLLASATLAQTPAITNGGIVNAASYAAGSLAPGSLATLFGSNLAASNATAAGVPLPVQLGGASVTVNGAPAPLIYVSSGQINFQVPFEIAGQSQASVVVSVNGTASPAQSIAIVPAAPGIFFFGARQGAIVVASTGELATSARPVRRGEFISIYATGLGPVTNPPASGSGGLASPLSTVMAATSATVGGVAATVAFAGLTPPGPYGPYAGLYQINAQIPTGAPLGDSIPVIVTANGAQSNVASIAVGPDSGIASLSRWVQFNAAGAAVARAITSLSTCPQLVLDGRSQQMQIRAPASPPLYPVLSCEAVIPASTKAASIDGKSLPLPTDDPKAITVIGDTGCRVELGNYQACNDPDAWPVAKLARSVAGGTPDLIIHNGDSHYREGACPPGNAGCAGSPWGYNWEVWNADLFTPIEPAFAAAPFLFIRGNHEMCTRAGEGWMRFLDPYPYKAECEKFTEPFSVQAGALQLIVMDSSEAVDTRADAVATPPLTAHFETVRKMAGANAWILMHHPIWGINTTQAVNLTLQAASSNSLPAGIKLVMAGHVHVFEALTFSPARAPQMIVGNGGDLLVAAPASPLTSFTVGGASVTAGVITSAFGYTTFEPAGEGSWTAKPRDVNGAVQMTCTVSNQAINCVR
jgi:uncharacterized protein (TIGR03437 family)